MVKLDRFLILDEWDAYFGGAIKSILPKPALDHFLVLLEGGGGFTKGPLPSDSRTCGLRWRVLRT